MNEVQLKQAMAEILSAEPTFGVDSRRALSRGKAARRARWLKASVSTAVLAGLVVAAVPASRGFLVGDERPPGPAGQKIVPLPSRTAPYNGYPDSIAVIGHTTSAGYHSDPANPAITVPANSWATGTNLQVNSLYQRILARHPAIRGHATNLYDVSAAMGEASGLAGQASAQTPPPDLLVMQVLDYDVSCPALPGDVDQLERAVVASLQILHERAPNTRVFMVSQFGSPTTSVQALNPAQRAEFGRNFAEFSCVVLDPDGQLIPNHLSEFESAIHGYEAAAKAACAQFPMCRYDNGAFGRIVEAQGDFGPDFNHLSVQGQAKAADVAWKALQDAGYLPAD